MDHFILKRAPAAMLAGMFVAAMTYTYLQVAQLPFDASHPDAPTYRDFHPLRWRVLWVTINLASLVSALSVVIIALGRVRRSRPD